MFYLVCQKNSQGENLLIQKIKALKTLKFTMYKWSENISLQSFIDISKGLYINRESNLINMMLEINDTNIFPQLTYNEMNIIIALKHC